MALTFEELAKRVARCIGIYETNRGGNDPKPRQSELDTVAGVHASMATIEQATMPYAVGALIKNETLRKQVIPELTLTELAAADECCKAVVKLLALVDSAVASGTTPSAFIKANGPAIADSSLGENDVETMFAAVALKKTLAKLRAAVAKKTMTLAKAIASIPAADRLGLGTPSLSSYIKTAKNWGESRAGWQRKAVNGMPNAIGARITTVSESASGTALAIPTTLARLKKVFGKTQIPATKAGLKPFIVKAAQLNNPNQAGYGTKVWGNYDRLY